MYEDSTHCLVHLLGLPVSDPEPARLVVQAVRARHQLPERARPGEPRLQVKLHGLRRLFN